jgi:hypothetical protein
MSCYYVLQQISKDSVEHCSCILPGITEVQSSALPFAERSVSHWFVTLWKRKATFKTINDLRSGH